MPLIPIYPSAAFIKQLHGYLIEVYREDLQPKHIEPGYIYEGLIDGVAERISIDKPYGGKQYRNFVERVAYCLYHLNRDHPFSDGNKRTSLLVTYYFLMWNGYFLVIPPNADVFLKAIADAKRTDLTERDVYVWLVNNIKVNFFTCLLHLIIAFGVVLSKMGKTSRQREFISFMIPHSETTFEEILTEMNVKY